MLDCGSQRYARFHGDIPHRLSKTEPVDEVQGYRHIDRIDCDHLIVYF